MPRLTLEFIDILARSAAEQGKTIGNSRLTQPEGFETLINTTNCWT
jgi:hypothetical protein